jgi:hypothetical protein
MGIFNRMKFWRAKNWKTGVATGKLCSVVLVSLCVM